MRIRKGAPFVVPKFTRTGEETDWKGFAVVHNEDLPDEEQLPIPEFGNKAEKTFLTKVPCTILFEHIDLEEAFLAYVNGDEELSKIMRDLAITTNIIFGRDPEGLGYLTRGLPTVFDPIDETYTLCDPNKITGGKLLLVRSLNGEYLSGSTTSNIPYKAIGVSTCTDAEGVTSEPCPESLDQIGNGNFPLTFELDSIDEDDLHRDLDAFETLVSAYGKLGLVVLTPAPDDATLFDNFDGLINCMQDLNTGECILRLGFGANLIPYNNGIYLEQIGEARDEVMGLMEGDFIYRKGVETISPAEILAFFQ